MYRSTKCLRGMASTSYTRSMTRTFASEARLSKEWEGKTPTAIVLLNMGGPSSLPETHDFLKNLFSDGDLIPLPFQSILAPMIAKRRTPRIEKQYADIGGGSPIRRYTEEQGRRMCELLDEISPGTAPHKSYVAFRYANPLTHDTLAKLKEDGIQRAVAFTQYPQYSCSTTGSSLNEIYRRSSRGAGGNIKWSVVDRWQTHPGLIEAFVANIRKTLSSLPPSRRSKAVILFSAHSLPMSVVNRGDPYVSEVAMTVGAVTKRLSEGEDPLENPYRLVWQSQVGPSAWMGQQTNEAIKGLARLADVEDKRVAKAKRREDLQELASVGYRDVLLVPIAFTTDHIETLFELDLEYIHEGKELGLNMMRAESLNLSPIFIRAMADIVADHLKSVEVNGKPPVSNQMMLRCPGCKNETCGEQKRWFAGWGSSQ